MSLHSPPAAAGHDQAAQGEEARGPWRGNDLDRGAEDGAADGDAGVALVEVHVVLAGVDERGDVLEVRRGGRVALALVAGGDAVDVEAVGVGAAVLPVAEPIVGGVLEVDGGGGDRGGVDPEGDGVEG